jgi:hypothetical protein
MSKFATMTARSGNAIIRDRAPIFFMTYVKNEIWALSLIMVVMMAGDGLGVLTVCRR